MKKRGDAREWIERSIEERHPILAAQLGSEPFYDALRPDPRFQALLGRLRIA